MSFLEWFPKRTNVVQKLDLIELRDQLLDMKDGDDGIDILDNVVAFYTSMSHWYDRITEFDHLLSNLRDPQKKQLQKLRNMILFYGRDRYGINRALPGEPITEDNIFLGNIYGLFTKPVSFWKTKVHIGDQEVDEIIFLQCSTILQGKGSIVHMIDSLQDQ